MNKEELLKWADDSFELYYQEVVDKLNEFFESNVCIPKGENRHTDADVIHAYAEGLSDIEVLRKEGWIEFKQGGMCLCIGDSYRIKPSEPIYEWQWLIQDVDSYRVSDNGRFMIENETCSGMRRIEETKRERK